MTLQPRRIVIATAGSLGDLHPFIAIARELQRRGHAPAIATLPCYARTVADAGIACCPIRPHIAMDDPALMRSIAASPRGLERLIAEYLLPNRKESFADLQACAKGADAMLVGSLSYAAPAVADACGIPWCWAILSPAFLSTSRHPAPAAVREAWSPRRVLALFSKLLAPSCANWPHPTAVTGFPFYDGGDTGPPPQLARFLDAGEPPIVFTLGSAAVFDAGTFYEDSARAARTLGRRAVVLTGTNPPPSNASDDVFAVSYAAFSAIFPRAAAIVHAGGIGTVGQALRAGRPMLVVPRFLDQPDNAARIRRLGVGRVMHASAYTADTAAAELAQLLSNPSYAARARDIAPSVRAENGTAVACDAFEREMAAAG